MLGSANFFPASNEIPLLFARHIADQRKKICRHGPVDSTARYMLIPRLRTGQCWKSRLGTAVLLLSDDELWPSGHGWHLQWDMRIFIFQAAHQPAFGKQFLPNALWLKRAELFASFRSASVAGRCSCIPDFRKGKRVWPPWAAKQTINWFIWPTGVGRLRSFAQPFVLSALVNRQN